MFSVSLVIDDPELKFEWDTASFSEPGFGYELAVRILGKHESICCVRLYVIRNLNLPIRI
ncbi:hypothetical protein RchiOBHm_Chr4g0413521 [Rosa chinensis]|uniref:Uncharacterized protein n=1 Tax=Rosa chinensis TaxID=74649 RepID=A0A2P6QW31_ROSCH|nr:hypothetical protein RchiOBHm_Chr4g0413521 [Rosa chinensis]